MTTPKPSRATLETLLSLVDATEWPHRVKMDVKSSVRTVGRVLGGELASIEADVPSLRRRLEGMSRVQQRFVSDVSHELRTPLTTVRMAADVLHDSRDQFDPQTARSAELLQTQLDRFEFPILGDVVIEKN
jgi:signal transduction histidine kinase